MLGVLCAKAPRQIRIFRYPVTSLEEPETFAIALILVGNSLNHAVEMDIAITPASATTPLAVLKTRVHQMS